MDHEVSVQSVAGRGRGACPRSAQADLRGARSPHHSRGGLARPYPHAGGVPTAVGAGEARGISEGPIVADAATRLSASAQAVLGATSVGTWILLRDGGRG